MENKKFKVDTSKVAECIKNWDTIICSVSTAKRNGKVTNRLTRVKKDGYGKCIESFCAHHNEKLTNYIVGTVELDYIPNNENEPNILILVERINELNITGEFKQFVPTLVEDTWVYDLVKVNL
ncbi:MAG: hypothetical protein ACRC1T_09055 [Clostridium chrysemydis]|uniref:hypothetical protein n=1 Tax=Clostridium chrysemydis TaxID=2665504 RepID=UPI003F2B7D22